MSSSISDARRSTLVRQAIQVARRAAPKDDHAFVDTLRAETVAKLLIPSGGGALSTSRSASRRKRGASLTDDPRYLSNVRALARRHTSNARIIGGFLVAGHEFDDCVAVGDDADFGCTGTLIARNAVLTAGHCKALHTRIFIGNDTEKRGRVFRVARYVRHPRWDSDYHNDLMLLILEKPVTGVKPRAMASTALIDRAIDARVVGFGTTDLAGTAGYGIKRKADVPIVSIACRGKVAGRSDGTVYGCHVGKEIVAGKPLLLQDTCKGDSGGPLYVANSKGAWFLAGVTSRGTELAKTMCGDGGLYTRVDRYQGWIAAELK